MNCPTVSVVALGPRIMAAFAFGLLLLSCSQVAQKDDSDLNHNIQDGHQLDGEPLPDRSVDSYGRFHAMAKNLFTGDLFCETGKNPKEANEISMELCRDNAPDLAGCVLKISATTTTMHPRESGGFMTQWSCFAEETSVGESPFSARTWVSCSERVSTRKKAEENALQLCRQLGSASGCRVVRCFNTDTDKTFR